MNTSNKKIWLKAVAIVVLQGFLLSNITISVGTYDLKSLWTNSSLRMQNVVSRTSAPLKNDEQSRNSIKLPNLKKFGVAAFLFLFLANPFSLFAKERSKLSTVRQADIPNPTQLVTKDTIKTMREKVILMRKMKILISKIAVGIKYGLITSFPPLNMTDIWEKSAGLNSQEAEQAVRRVVTIGNEVIREHGGRIPASDFPVFLNGIMQKIYIKINGLEMVTEDLRQDENLIVPDIGKGKPEDPKLQSHIVIDPKELEGMILIPIPKNDTIAQEVLAETNVENNSELASLFREVLGQIKNDNIILTSADNRAQQWDKESMKQVLLFVRDCIEILNEIPEGILEKSAGKFPFTIESLQKYGGVGKKGKIKISIKLHLMEKRYIEIGSDNVIDKNELRDTLVHEVVGHKIADDALSVEEWQEIAGILFGKNSSKAKRFTKEYINKNLKRLNESGRAERLFISVAEAIAYSLTNRQSKYVKDIHGRDRTKEIRAILSENLLRANNGKHYVFNEYGNYRWEVREVREDTVLLMSKMHNYFLELVDRMKNGKIVAISDFNVPDFWQRQLGLNADESKQAAELYAEIHNKVLYRRYEQIAQELKERMDKLDSLKIYERILMRKMWIFIFQLSQGMKNGTISGIYNFNSAETWRKYLVLNTDESERAAELYVETYNKVWYKRYEDIAEELKARIKERLKSPPDNERGDSTRITAEAQLSPVQHLAQSYLKSALNGKVQLITASNFSSTWQRIVSWMKSDVDAEEFGTFMNQLYNQAVEILKEKGIRLSGNKGIEEIAKIMLGLINEQDLKNSIVSETLDSLVEIRKAAKPPVPQRLPQPISHSL